MVRVQTLYHGLAEKHSFVSTYSFLPLHLVVMESVSKSVSQPQQFTNQNTYQFYFYFFSCIVSMGFFPHILLLLFHLYCLNGISLMGNSGCFPWGKPAATELHYPTPGACWVFQCFHNPSNSDMDYRTFNVRADVIACNCTLGCMDTRKRVH